MLPTVQTLILTGLALLGSGYVILGILSLTPRFQTFTREAWPILMTETLIVGIVAAAVWIGGVILFVAILALVFRCVWEASKVASVAHPKATFSPVPIAGTATLAALVASFLPIGALGILCILGFFGVLYLGYFSTLKPEANASLLLDIAVFPGLPLIVFAAAGLQGGFEAWLLVAYIFVETFDSYALAAGKLFGRTKAFPTLSPRKTIEGLVFGAIALMLTAALGALIFDLPILASMAVALLAGILTITGDLAASGLKRRSGVKDFPAVLPQHGGLLDITDAWIATGAGLATLAALTGLV